jgi:predicted TIM-barrel fold metal-dependent hydrolase
MIEFLFDTTRAVVNLVLNGTITRCPDLEIIVPHAGATLPMIADRVAAFALALGIDSGVDVFRDLGRMHFDLAGYPIPRQLDALLTLTTLEHLHYGSDYPFTPEFVATMACKRIDDAGDPPGSVTDALLTNSARLFPELGAAAAGP